MSNAKTYVYSQCRGVVTEDIYQLLINITDKLEVTISEYIRDLIEKNLIKK